MKDVIEGARKRVDEIDDGIAGLFAERLSLVEEIAGAKKKAGLPILDAAREREIADRLAKNLAENGRDALASYARTLFGAVFGLSRLHQAKLMGPSSKIADEMRAAREGAPGEFPETASVACQGSMGSNSMAACERLFACPLITYVDTFESVFRAVDAGLCRYGVLPIENSLYGSVTDAYNLMKKHRFYVVKSAKLKINHVLLAKPGARLSDVRRIRSHEQALGQCGNFVAGLKGGGVRIEHCGNTATAAKEISEGDAMDVAAIASKRCAELYGLVALEENIQDSDDNYTKFVCVSKRMEIYPGAEKNSLMTTVPHRPGALSGLIAKFTEFGVNMTKIESRLPPHKDDPVFYVDFDAPVSKSELLVSSLEAGGEDFAFLGCYSEA